MGGLSRPQKICAGVCCGVVLVLAIMLPVGLFAIGPKMSQGYLDKSTLQITNATLYYPSHRGNQTWAIQIVHANMHNPAPFGVHVKEFEQVMSMYSSLSNLTIVGAGFDNITGTKLAKFMFPAQTLKPGDNSIEATVNMSLTAVGDSCGKSSSCFGIFQVLAAFSRSFGLGAYMSLEGSDMHIKTMGLGVPGSFHSKFDMNCSVYAEFNETTGKWVNEVLPTHPVNVSEIPQCLEVGGCVKPTQIMCDTAKIPVSAEPGYTTTTVMKTTSTTSMPSKEFLM